MTKKIQKKVSKKSVKKSAKKPVKVSKQKPAKKVKKPVKTAVALRTYITIVLDCSSSMSSIKAETIAHFNEQIEQITKDSIGLDTRVSLVTFNNNVSEHFFNQPVSTLTPLTARTYLPSGMTAMYDAVGHAIDKLESVPDTNKKDVAVLVIVLSDGYENASREYNQERLADKIKGLQETGRWTFSYLGANQDLTKIVDKLNIPRGNVTAFVADAAGMAAATNTSTGSVQAYMADRRLGITQTTSYYNVQK